MNPEIEAHILARRAALEVLYIAFVKDSAMHRLGFSQAVLDDLEEAGHVKRISPAQYRITSAGRAHFEAGSADDLPF